MYYLPDPGSTLFYVTPYVAMHFCFGPKTIFESNSMSPSMMILLLLEVYLRVVWCSSFIERH